MSIVRFRTTCSRYHEPHSAHSVKTFIWAAVAVGVAVAVFVAASVAAPDPYSHLHHDRLKRTRYVAWQLECCQQGILSKHHTAWVIAKMIIARSWRRARTSDLVHMTGVVVVLPEWRSYGLWGGNDSR